MYSNGSHDASKIGRRPYGLLHDFVTALLAGLAVGDDRLMIPHPAIGAGRGTIPA
jgi:hypothetical protein